MKINYLSLLLSVIIIVLLGTVSILTGEYYEQREEIDRQQTNFEQLGNENQFLTLKVEEMRTLIKQGDRRLRKTDSIFTQKKLKISYMSYLEEIS